MSVSNCRYDVVCFGIHQPNGILLLCMHFEKSSLLLFKVVVRFLFIISTFSCKHKLHFFCIRSGRELLVNPALPNNALSTLFSNQLYLVYSMLLLYAVEHCRWSDNFLKMNKLRFSYSLKNIALPKPDAYLGNLIEKTESLVNRLRWKAHFFINGNSSTLQHENV